MDFGETTKDNPSKTEKKCKQSIGKNEKRSDSMLIYFCFIVINCLIFVVILYTTECTIGL
jgi:predicted nucleic acid-binding Zn ribbon protein